MSADEISVTGSDTNKAGEITWRDGDVPFSPHFGDVYYNPKNGLAESRYVFVDGNDLPRAWQGKTNFTIGETGFGTGLNFLAAWDCWAGDPQRSERLHFISVEKYPLSRDDMLRAHHNWPELSALSRQLGAVWPDGTILPGTHRFSLADGRVTLTLLVGDAIDCYDDYDGCVDCWFLDGFAPARNPDMWAPELFRALAKASSPAGATLATFTAARIARDGLEQGGFTVGKRKGFGYKRDMVTATLPAREIRTTDKTIEDDPWFILPAGSPARKVAIVGGGMAGAACAHALRLRGCEVVLFEKNTDLASAASGNPIGMLEPSLTADRSLTGRFLEAGFRFSQALIRQLSDKGQVEADFCGVLDLCMTKRDAERQNGLLARLPDKPDLVRFLDRQAASATFGLPLAYGGVFYPSAGWVNPPSLVKFLSQDIEIQFKTEISELSGDEGQKWLRTVDGLEFGPFDAVILAGAIETTQMSQTSWLSDYLRPVRGQISYFDTELVAPNRDEHRIQCVLSHKGYLTPARNGLHVFGATFDRDDAQNDLRERDHAFNIAQLGNVLPELAEKLAGVLANRKLDGRAALRTTTPDHLPVIGPAPDYARYLSAYYDIDKGRKWARYIDAPCHKGVYICTGFGARGLITAPLAAEILASEICAMPLPLEKSLINALHPGRFIVRGLKRRQIIA